MSLEIPRITRRIARHLVRKPLGKVRKELHVARMQKQKDRTYSAVFQIVADGDQDAAGHDAKYEGTANCDAMEGGK